MKEPGKSACTALACALLLGAACCSAMSGPQGPLGASGGPPIALSLDPASPEAGREVKVTVTVPATEGWGIPPAQEDVVVLRVSGNLEDFQILDDRAREALADGSGARYAFSTTFPSGGTHWLVIFFPNRGRTACRAVRLSVAGPRQDYTRWNYSRVRREGGIEGILIPEQVPLIRLWDIDFKLYLSGANRPVTEIAPLAGAPALAAIFRDDGSEPDCLALLASIPGGEPGARPGPRLRFRLNFRWEGRYRAFVIFGIEGKARALPFDLWVEEELQERMLPFR